MIGAGKGYRRLVADRRRGSAVEDESGALVHLAVIVETGPQHHIREAVAIDVADSRRAQGDIDQVYRRAGLLGLQPDIGIVRQARAGDAQRAAPEHVGSTLGIQASGVIQRAGDDVAEAVAIDIPGRGNLPAEML